MRPRWPLGMFVLWLVVFSAGPGPKKSRAPARPASPEREAGEGVADDALSLSKAVACRSIEGYERYEPLPEAALTSEEKLLVYYRPSNFKTERVGAKYRAHLIQDGEIHRRGEKAVLSRKEHMVDYEVENPTPPDLLFIRNSVSLKTLTPGEYDYVMILHDAIGKGPSARGVLPFRIVPVRLPKPEDGAASGPP